MTLLPPERRLDDFAKIEIRDEVRSLIMKENAVRPLGLAAGRARGREAGISGAHRYRRPR
jgi:hypothetical protein